MTTHVLSSSAIHSERWWLDLPFPQLFLLLQLVAFANFRLAVEQQLSPFQTSSIYLQFIVPSAQFHPFLI